MEIPPHVELLLDVSILKPLLVYFRTKIETSVLIHKFYLGNDEAYERTPIIDWSRFNLARQAFQTCETDGEEGLTWDEVDSCEVRVYKIAFPSFSTYKCGKNNYDSKN